MFYVLFLRKTTRIRLIGLMHDLEWINCNYLVKKFEKKIIQTFYKNIK